MLRVFVKKQLNTNKMILWAYCAISSSLTRVTLENFVISGVSRYKGPPQPTKTVVTQEKKTTLTKQNPIQK